jgi:hypothetical protein
MTTTEATKKITKKEKTALHKKFCEEFMRRPDAQEALRLGGETMGVRSMGIMNGCVEMKLTVGPEMALAIINLIREKGVWVAEPGQR